MMRIFIIQKQYKTPLFTWKYCCLHIKNRSDLYQLPYLSYSTQNKVQKNKNKIKKSQRKSQHLRENIIQVPKNNKFRKTRSRLGQENHKKEVDPIAPNSEAESQQNILQYIGNTNTGKQNKNEEEAIPPPLRSRGVFIVGFPPTTPSNMVIIIYCYIACIKATTWY